MIAYRTAKHKALKIIPKADSYAEYPDAYIFTNSKAKGDEQWDNECVIDKESGDIISYSEYIMTSKYAGKEIEWKGLED